MLKSLRLTNFRGFDDHELNLRQKTVVVGANNAGKSTVVEAMNLVSLVANRYRNLSYLSPQQGSGLPMRYKVVSPSLKGLDINFTSIFHLLRDPPAVITAEFTGGEVIELYLNGGERAFAVIRDSAGEVVKNRREASKVNIPPVHILPQVAPLAGEERLLNTEYVRGNLASKTAPLHFRNQLRLMPEFYAEFRKLAEETWPGLRIRELIDGKAEASTALGLLVQDGDFVSEIGWMGHGLQIWLQTIWFLARTPSIATVILDEPDVYLHPDLQRRLIRVIRSKFRQVIVATHSVEIMSEVQPNEILVINRSQKVSRYADDHPTVQRLVEHIGSAHNISLARLLTSKRFLLVEGTDLDYLGHFHALLCQYPSTPLANLPHLPLGGWGGWDVVIGTSMLLQNYLGEEIVSYCLFDSDYHTPNQINSRYDDANKRHVELHIWSRKEIENYLLVPPAISRVICNRARPATSYPSADEISAKIDALSEELKEDVLEGFGNEFLPEDRLGGYSSAKRKAENLANSRWQTREGRWSLVPGKQILAKLSEWANVNYGVSFGPKAVLMELREEEVPREVVRIVRAIEQGKSLTLLRDGVGSTRKQGVSSSSLSVPRGKVGTRP